MIEIFAVIAMAIVASGTAIFTASLAAIAMMLHNGYVLLFLWALKIFRGK